MYKKSNYPDPKKMAEILEPFSPKELMSWYKPKTWFRKKITKIYWKK